jgi:hypothetical protein
VSLVRDKLGALKVCATVLPMAEPEERSTRTSAEHEEPSTTQDIGHPAPTHAPHNGSKTTVNQGCTDALLAQGPVQDNPSRNTHRQEGSSRRLRRQENAKQAAIRQKKKKKSQRMTPKRRTIIDNGNYFNDLTNEQDRIGDDSLSNSRCTPVHETLENDQTYGHPRKRTINDPKSSDEDDDDFLLSQCPWRTGANHSNSVANSAKASSVLSQRELGGEESTEVESKAEQLQNASHSQNQRCTTNAAIPQTSPEAYEEEQGHCASDSDEDDPDDWSEVDEDEDYTEEDGYSTSMENQRCTNWAAIPRINLEESTTMTTDWRIDPCYRVARIQSNESETTVEDNAHIPELAVNQQCTSNAVTPERGHAISQEDRDPREDINPELCD